MHYGKTLGEATQLYVQGGEALLAALKLFDTERANIEAAQAWAAANLEHNDQAVSWLAVHGIWRDLLHLRLPTQTQIDWLEKAAKACERIGDLHGKGAALGNLGLAWAELGELRKAIYFHEQDLAIAREIGDRRSEGMALGNLGLAWKDLRETRKAVSLFEQRLMIAREVGDRRGEGKALGNLGLAWADLGEFEEAIDLYEQQLVITREIGDRLGENTALWNMALANEKLGDTTQAIKCAKASLALHRQIKDPFIPKIEAWLRQHGTDPNTVM